MAALPVLARGVAFNWVGLAFSLAVTFFLSPFVVNQLGPVSYGVWALTQSLIAYLALLDLGVRSAVTRFIARERERGDHLQASRVVSAALWLRVVTALVVASLSFAMSQLAGRLFAIPPELHDAARQTIMIVGLTLGTSLTFGVFGGVLAALNRFDLLSTVGIVQTALRAAGAVWLLKTGHGVAALALWELTVALMAGGALTALCFCSYPQLRILLSPPRLAEMREMWTYSAYAFVINIFVQVIYYTDTLVVAGFLSVGAVTFYAIAGGLVEHLRSLVSSMTMTFTPLASSLDAAGQRTRLGHLLIHGTRAALLVALPVAAVLFFRGETFIDLWMGEQYGAVSGPVLQILLIAQVFALANFTSGGIAYGMGRHAPIAVWAGAEAVANLALTVVLVRWFGLQGVAWGTVIPSLVIHLLVWPPYICRLVGMPVGRYLWQAWGRPGLAVIPFGLACHVADQRWLPASLVQFFLQIVVLLSAFGLGVALAFWNDINPRLTAWVRNSALADRS